MLPVLRCSCVVSPARSRRPFTIVAVVVVAVLIALPLFGSSDRFQLCFDHHRDWLRSLAGPAKDYARFRVALTCGLGDDDVLTVLSTFVLAAFTVTLWWSTDKLWQADQARQAETNRLISATEESARAAAAQAEVSQKALIASNRPHLVIKPYLSQPFGTLLEVANGQTNDFRFDVLNKGNSLAIVRSSWGRFDYLIGKITDAMMPGVTVQGHYYFIEASDEEPGVLIPIATPDLDVRAAVLAGRLQLYASFGYKYELLAGSEHETRFCWQHDPHDDRFCKPFSEPMNRRT